MRVHGNRKKDYFFFPTKIVRLPRKGWSLLTVVYDQSSLGESGLWSGAQSRGVSREKTRAVRSIFFPAGCPWFLFFSRCFQCFLFHDFLVPLSCFFVLLSGSVLFNACLYLLYCFVHVLFLCPFGTMFFPFGRILCPFGRILCLLAGFSVLLSGFFAL